MSLNFLIILWSFTRSGSVAWSSNRARNGFLFEMARLFDPGQFFGNFFGHRTLPCLHRWQTEDNDRVLDGKPKSQGSSDHHILGRLVSVGCHDVGYHERDVLLRISILPDVHCLPDRGNARIRAVPGTLAIPAPSDQRQWGRLDQLFQSKTLNNLIPDDYQAYNYMFRPPLWPVMIDARLWQTGCGFDPWFGVK